MRNQVRYVVGDTNGRDHQFWPTLTKAQMIALGLTSDTDIGNWNRGLSYPIAMTLDQIQIMSWRVREWKVAGTNWTASSAAFDIPVTSQDDIAQLNDVGTLPEFRFRIQRRTVGTGIPRDVIDEGDILGDWSEFTLKGDFQPPAYTVGIWKTSRNLGVSQGHSDGFTSNGLVAAADPTQIHDAFNFTEPYNHAKFGNSGSVTNGFLVIFTMAGYILFDPVTHLFYPPLLLSFGGAVLPVNRAGRPGVNFNLLPLTPSPLPSGFTAPIPCGLFTIDFGGAGPDPVQCQIFRDNPGRPPGPGTAPPNVASLNLTMSPTAWWAYRTSNGNPVYNTSDGSQQAGPFL